MSMLRAAGETYGQDPGQAHLMIPGLRKLRSRKPCSYMLLRRLVTFFGLAMGVEPIALQVEKPPPWLILNASGMMARLLKADLSIQPSSDQAVVCTRASHERDFQHVRAASWMALASPHTFTCKDHSYFRAWVCIGMIPALGLTNSASCGLTAKAPLSIMFSATWT